MDAEWASAELYDLGTVGIEELRVESLLRPVTDAAAGFGRPESLDGLVALRAGFASADLAAEAARLLDPRWAPRAEVVVGDDWLDAWREHFDPIRCGRVVVVPAWKSERELEGSPVLASLDAADLVIRLDPGRSFGTGGHASTMLCLEALQWITEQGELAGAPVLDFGCGSGVLAVAATLLGAESAFAVDVEAAAIEATEHNAEHNGVADRVTGRVGTRPPEGMAFPIVLANILAPVLRELAEAISASIRPGGLLVLAGFVEDQVPGLLACYPEFATVRVGTHDTWRSLTLRKHANALGEHGNALGDRSSDEH